MAVSIELRDGYQLVTVSGYLDSHTEDSQQLKTFLLAPAETINTHTVVDLSQTEYINSSMLGMFVRYMSIANEKSVSIVLMNPGSSVRMVLDMTGLSQLMPVIESEEQIAEALQQAPTTDFFVGEVDHEVVAEEIEHIIKGDDRNALSGNVVDRLRKP